MNKENKVVNNHVDRKDTFKGVIEGYNIDWWLKLAVIVASIYFSYVSYVGNQREASEYATASAQARGAELQQQVDTNEWAEHAYKGFNCWSRESRLYSEDTKRCTADALLDADKQQNSQIDANSSVSGANAQTLREVCEILYAQGLIGTCSNLP